MKKMTANEIRKTWLRFFEKKGHYIEPGSSLVPSNDPTLLWINSGVAALKKYFDGSELPKNKRITNVQKSLRTNDIENVGHTARHHTFFEMLGNFSIGDYFREEAITWAFEILTSEEYFGISKEKLYFTYHPHDLITKRLWMKHGIEEEHLIPLEDNFWQIGDGPCGPNTEMFYDRGEKYDPAHQGIRLLKEDVENDRYIEIWNIVFSQYNAVEGVRREDYKELPHKNIDTGAGLERIACVLQETETNFETDLFLPIIKETEKLANVHYSEGYKMCYRVISDHIRTCTFALSDGASFANEGRGYVLRRILRRAMRYGRKIGITKVFLYKLVPVVVEVMGDFYPYLKEREDFVAKSIKAEEEKFLKTLTSGESMLRKMMEDGKQLSGKDAFKLYDTYGFPIELTKEICEEEGMTIDEDGFKAEMLEQKERARNARASLQSMNHQAKDLMEFIKESHFIYQMDDLEATVIGLFKDGILVDEIEDEGDIVLDITNFYAESGGQASDKGRMANDDCSLDVIMVAKAPNKQHLHHVKVDYGRIKAGDRLTLTIDKAARMKTMRNHSAVHLLQKALSIVLGDHVHQQGSFVNDQYFRFDFNHDQKIPEGELARIEEIVNGYIADSLTVITRVLPIEEARKLGARALFDEKYGEVVRVVCFADVSREFCGGTHVGNSEDIGVFAIQSEESIAAGIRRIQGTAGFNAYRTLKAKEDKLLQVRDLAGATSVSELGDRIKAVLEENKDMRCIVRQLQDREAAAKAKELSSGFRDIGGFKVLAGFISGGTRDSLLKMVDALKMLHPESIVLLIGEQEGILPLVCAISKGAQEKGIKAGSIIKEVSAILGGSGGGRPDLAFGGGKDKAMVEVAIRHVHDLLGK